MPNRIIREALLDSDRYHDLAHDSERLLFMELLLLADDFGLVPLNHAFLRRRTTPCAGKTVAQITTMVSALADHDLLRVYQSERGGTFAFIPRFGNPPRAVKPKWPAPPDTPGFKEVKDLAEKRRAYAKQSPTNATETETETETETTTSSPSEMSAPPKSVQAKAKQAPKRPRATGLPERPIDVSVQVWDDFLRTRSKLRAEVTYTALDGIAREAQRAGIALEDALRICCIKGWRAFDAGWNWRPALAQAQAMTAEQAADEALRLLEARDGKA